MRDYYYILGVAENAPVDQIKSAFRKLSMKFHPDKNNGEKFYEDQFRAIMEAWDVLSDPGKKAGYDQQLRRYKAAAADAAYKDALIRKYEAELRRQNTNQTATQNQPPPQAGPQHSWEWPWPPRLRSSYWQWAWQNDRSGYRIPRVVVIFTGTFLVFFFTMLYMRGPRDKSSSRITYIKKEITDSSAVNSTSQTPVSPASDPTLDPTLLTDNNETTTLKKYLSDVGHMRSQFAMKDLDKDSIPELQITYHTGGAHCCNVDHLFTQNESGQFQLVFSYMGGMYMSDNKLSLYYYQDLGYYHSCYGCTITDKLPKQDVNAEINVLFDHGKLLPAAVDEPLNKSISTNLAFLSGKGIPDLDADGMDDGSRKEFMLHMVTYHFNNHDLEKTKVLFDQYYAWNDRMARWNDLQAMISRYEEIIFRNAAYRKKLTF